MRETRADLILTGGNVLTMDAGFAKARAVAVAGGRILAVGPDAEIAALADADTRRIDLAGRTAMPGLIDGHAHLDREGLKLRLPSLGGCRSIDDVLQRIEALAAVAEPGQWIVTMPIGDPPFYEGVPANLRENRFPTRWELDRVAPDNPVYIRAIWGHWRNTLPLVSVANSAALAAAGITRSTPAPAASIQICKDFDSGEPTGVFIEWSYKPIVEHTLLAGIPRFSLADRVAGLKDSMRIYNGYGTTSVFEGHGVAAEVIAAWSALRDEGPLPVRASLVFSPAWRSTSPDDVAQLVQSWAAWLRGKGLGDDSLRIGGIYTETTDFDAESPLRARTTPYTGWAGFNYDTALPREAMLTLMTEAARNGIRVAGIRFSLLDLFAEADKVAPIGELRWVIEHIDLMNADQIARCRDLGVGLTTYTNRYIYQIGSVLRRQVGEARAQEIVPMRSLLDARVHVSLATDNVPPTLWPSVWNVVARIDQTTGEAIAPEQCISREEALACATREGAWLTFDEGEKGSLEPGKLADIVVLSADPLTVPQAALPEIVADIAIVGGREVYRRPAEG